MADYQRGALQLRAPVENLMAVAAIESSGENFWTIGNVFCFDVPAGNGLLSLPTLAALLPYFRVGVVGIGSSSNYVAVTPEAADRINGASAGTAKNVIADRAPPGST